MLGMKKRVNRSGPNRTGRAINVWLSHELYAALEAYKIAQRPGPTTTSVVEVALEDFLRGQGFWPPPDTQ